MLGFSIFFNDEITSETEAYIKNMSEAGFSGVFSSLHIPEDNSATYHTKLELLGAMLKKYQMNLMVDVSTLGLKALGYDIESSSDIEKIKALGVTGLRMDYGIPFSVIANLSHHITVGLNASTLTVDEVNFLKENGANFDHMELWHNYYPRVETGISLASFKEKNQLFHELGLKICAFAPGDEKLRGPLFETLPTIEDHRHVHPLVSTVELLEAGYVNDIYIGDPEIKLATMQQFKQYFQESLISLQVTELDSAHEELFIGSHTNRVDDARDVIRSQEARFKQLPEIRPTHPVVRRLGVVTLDNEKYGRYKGELQITKHDLPQDDRVNVVARVIEADRSLISIIRPGMTFELIKEQE